MKNNNLFSVENKITITVRENSYTVRVPFSFKHLLKDFSSKFLSYAYIYNKRQKRRVAVLDKSFFIKREFADYISYTFVRESLMDLTVYLKFRGIDILNKDEFEIVIAEKFIPKDIEIKLQDKYVLREDQSKYLTAIMENNMSKALIEARPGFGKLQPLDSLIRIPNGWKRMGDMQVGDNVIARDGTTTKVIGVYPQGMKKIFKITFADGRSTEAGGEHLWKIYHRDINKNRSKSLNAGSEYKVINTYELIARLNKKIESSRRHYIDLVISEQNKDKIYLIHPYVLGCMLGDGSLSLKNGISFTISDSAVVDRMQKLIDKRYVIKLNGSRGIDYRLNFADKKYYGISRLAPHVYRDELMRINLLGKYSWNKFIPIEYLNGSTEQRWELLRGLMDTDGCVEKKGSISYSSSSEQLAKDVQLLVRSLGGIAMISTKLPSFTYKGEKRIGRLSYTVNIRLKNPSLCVTRLPKRAERLSETNQYSKNLKLRVKSIEFIGEKEAQCIAIEHPEHLYVTDDYIVTHNTITSLGIACAKKKRIMLLLPGYVEKWKLDVLNTLDITEEDVYVIQGKDSIIKLINKIKNKEEINYKVYIVSEASLMPYADKDRESYGKGYMEISDIIRYLEIGTILIDEIHEKFFQSFYLLLLINTQLLIGMTGTYTSGNSYVRKFQDILFPAKTRLNFIKIERFTNTYAIDYELDNPRSAKYLQQNMYNHDTYENSTLISNRSKLLNFIDMLEYYLEDSYIRNYKEGNKMVIFVASVRFATMLAKYFQGKYRQFDIRRYTSDDPYENILEPDIIISTLQSAGTAIDIPKLKVVFNTVVSLSEVRNVQSHGRLRKLEGEEVLYYYFYSTSIPKHASFHKTRAEQLKPYSKEFKYIRYSKKI